MELFMRRLSNANVLCNNLNFYTSSAQPIHWVYKDEDLAKAVEGVNPEFLPKSVNPFYTQTTGQQSPYGDLLIVMLESLVACKGKSVAYDSAVQYCDFSN